MWDSDSAVKQILLSMNEKYHFIIEELDDFHLVIKADEEFRVRRELDVEASHLFIVISLYIFLFYLGECLAHNLSILRISSLLNVWPQ